MKQQQGFWNICGFDDRWLMIVGVPISSVIVSVMLFYNYYEQGNWAFLSICIPMSFVYTSCFWFSMRFAYNRVKKYYPDITDIGKRISIMFAVLMLVYLVINVVLDTLFQYLFADHHARPNQIMKCCPRCY